MDRQSEAAGAFGVTLIKEIAMLRMLLDVGRGK